MLIERNIIFVYPLTKELSELKDELEKDENLMIYELDSVQEYEQIIGVLEYSVTFSSDIKKTKSYLEQTKKISKSNQSKNYVVMDGEPPPLDKNKLLNLGINEFMLSSAPQKGFVSKINSFYNPLEQAAQNAEEKRLKEEEKKKAREEKSSAKNMMIGGDKKKKEVYNSNEKLRVEKMAVMDEDLEGPSKKRKKRTGFDLDSLLGGDSAFSNFELRSNKTGQAFLKSPFDQLQRKKVSLFNSTNSNFKMKKGMSFEPLMGELGRNPYRSSVGVKRAGELNRKKSLDLNLGDIPLDQRKKLFEEVERELGKKKNNFSEVEAELGRKKSLFKEIERELERKKGTQFHEVEAEGKKKKSFEEVAADLARKKANFTEVENELDKKRKKFEEYEAELAKKKKAFEEVENDSKKKKGFLDEMEELQKKRRALLPELEDLQHKKKTILDELEDPDKKKGSFVEVESEKEKRKKFDEEQGDLDKKKGLNLDEIVLDQKKKKFEEVENEGEKPKGLDFESLELDKQKKDQFTEAEREKKKHGQFEEVAQEREKAQAREQEEAEKQKKEALKNTVIAKSKEKMQEEQLAVQEKNQEENVLDYRKFKKEYREGSEEEQEEKELELINRNADRNTELAEVEFFEPYSHGLEYLVICNDFLLKEETDALSLMRFIHFALIKEFQGEVSFYLYDPSLVVQNGEQDLPKPCLVNFYDGHRNSKLKIVEDMEALEVERLIQWGEVKLPTWEDETYQIERNEFIYPYFEDGELLGVAVSHFKQTVTNHADAAKVELLLMSLKGVVHEEFIKNNET